VIGWLVFLNVVGKFMVVGTIRLKVLVWLPFVIVVEITRAVECPVLTDTLALEAINEAEVALLKGTLELGTIVRMLTLETL
jgi:hypothetical protein